jgi:transporter family-2 protein
LYLLAAMGVGVCAATQAVMLAAIGREKTPYEATWINMVAAIAGIALVLVARGIGGRTPLLPAPFDRLALFAAIAALGLIALAVSVKGLEPYYAITGFFALAYLLGIGFAAPKIGVALFLVGVTFGQLGGAVVYDHVGAFGNTVREAGALRVLGIGVVLVGAVMVRFGD